MRRSFWRQYFTRVGWTLLVVATVGALKAMFRG